MTVFASVTESACRYKVVAWLKPKFSIPADANVHYFGRSVPVSSDDPEKQLFNMSHSFSALCKAEFGVEVPTDFLVLSAKAMVHLQRAKRSNVLYNIARGCGELRSDQSDSRFPTTRMPMGLLEYMAAFYASDEMRKVCVYILLKMVYKYIH